MSLNKSYSSDIQKAIDVFSPKVEKSKLPMKETTFEGKSVFVIEDSVSKGILFGNINDVIADFLIEKTGKEIKEKISTIKSMDEANATTYMDTAKEYLKDCTIEPTNTDMIGDYELRGTKMKFGTIPMMFSWDECYACDQENQKAVQPSVQIYSQEVVKQPAVKIENPYRLYNQNIRMYVESRVESLILDTVMNNMSDTKKYKLTAEQASKLGF